MTLDSLPSDTPHGVKQQGTGMSNGQLKGGGASWWLDCFHDNRDAGSLRGRKMSIVDASISEHLTAMLYSIVLAPDWI